MIRYELVHDKYDTRDKYVHKAYDDDKYIQYDNDKCVCI